eukprot:3455800-Prorocentrum_lima.AAC.1
MPANRMPQPRPDLLRNGAMQQSLKGFPEFVQVDARTSSCISPRIATQQLPGSTREVPPLINGEDVQEGHRTSCGVPLPFLMHPSFDSCVLPLGACELRFLCLLYTSDAADDM